MIEEATRKAATKINFTEASLFPPVDEYLAESREQRMKHAAASWFPCIRLQSLKLKRCFATATTNNRVVAHHLKYSAAW